MEPALTARRLDVPERVIVAPPGHVPPGGGRRRARRGRPVDRGRPSGSSTASAPTPVRSPFTRPAHGHARPTPASGSAKASPSPGSDWRFEPQHVPRHRRPVPGWGMAVPDRRLTNDDLELPVDTSDPWIVERTGIRERRVAGPGETTATLATAAGAAAIKRRRPDPGRHRPAASSPPHPRAAVPPPAPFVQDGLGLRCGAFDIDAACAGFVYALVVGASMVADGPRPGPAHRRRDADPRHRPRRPGHGHPLRRRRRRRGPGPQPTRPACWPGTSGATAPLPACSMSPRWEPPARLRRRRSPRATTT